METVPGLNLYRFFFLSVFDASAGSETCCTVSACISVASKNKCLIYFRSLSVIDNRACDQI